METNCTSFETHAKFYFTVQPGSCPVPPQTHFRTRTRTFTPFVQAEIFAEAAKLKQQHAAYQKVVHTAAHGV